MADPRLHTAREHLSTASPADALDALKGAEGPGADWLRALAAGLLGDPVRAQVALRAVQRAGPLPATALHDVARPYAEAVLDDLPAARALRPLALAVHVERVDTAPSSDLHLAWDLVVLAAEDAAPADGPAHVLLLAALRRTLGDPEQALALARGAQDAARAAAAPDVLEAATLLVAELCLADGDPELAEAVIRHGARQLAALGAHVRLEERWAALLSARG